MKKVQLHFLIQGFNRNITCRWSGRTDLPVRPATLLLGTRQRSSGKRGWSWGSGGRGRRGGRGGCGGRRRGCACGPGGGAGVPRRSVDGQLGQQRAAPGAAPAARAVRCRPGRCKDHPALTAVRSGEPSRIALPSSAATRRRRDSTRAWLRFFTAMRARPIFITLYWFDGLRVVHGMLSFHQIALCLSLLKSQLGKL